MGGKIDPIEYYTNELLGCTPPAEAAFQSGFELGVLEMAKRWAEYESNPVVLNGDDEIMKHQVEAVESKHKFWEASLDEESE